jgi:UDP-N-acetylmuramoyl-tripeptide--D-alanyl-D-alanine ligase
MRFFLRKVIQSLLKGLAILTIKKFKPGVIGVTGSVGKTSTKQAVFAILRRERRVRVSKGSLNNEFGIPLTILGDWQDDDLRLVSKEMPAGGNFGKKLLFWLKVIGWGLVQLAFFSRRSYPEIIILEYGADHPKDIDYLLGIVKPQISILTAIGDIPVHVEFFKDPRALADEKAKLIEILPTTGVAVLNADDPRVIELRPRTRAHVLTYGFSESATVRISSFEHRREKNRICGISFKLEHNQVFTPVRIDNVVGKSQAYAAASAAAVGMAFGINLVRIAEALPYLEVPPRRARILAGIKNSTIIDDAYNASPASMRMALEAVQDIKAKRKVGILGDMLELGKYTVTAHEELGRLAGKTLDILFTVGDRAQFVAQAAQKAGIPKKNIFSFDSAESALAAIKKNVRTQDLILVKASRAIHLEKVTEMLVVK